MDSNIGISEDESLMRDRCSVKIKSALFGIASKLSLDLLDYGDTNIDFKVIRKPNPCYDDPAKYNSLYVIGPKKNKFGIRKRRKLLSIRDFEGSNSCLHDGRPASLQVQCYDPSAEKLAIENLKESLGLSEDRIWLDRIGYSLP